MPSVEQFSIVITFLLPEFTKYMKLSNSLDLHYPLLAFRQALPCANDFPSSFQMLRVSIHAIS